MGFRSVLNCLALCLGVVFAPSLKAGELTVFAAASLQEALSEIAEGFEARTGQPVTLSFAGSSALARQIEYGAPVDIFVSASRDWMNHLEAQGGIDPASRFDLARNTLVLIGTAGRAETLSKIDKNLDLLRLLDGGRIAMALTEAVPAGIYGRAALEALGLWGDVQPQVAETDNVRAAMALVALGAAPLGIVYATDALADARVSQIGVFPAETHPKIVYPVAKTPRAREPQASQFLDYLRSDAADEVLRRYGFLLTAE